jgi:predicted HicB family RNase H-like nuclease
MIPTNVNISKKAQKFLIKAAAERNISVEKLASEILNESSRTKISGLFPNR